MQGKSWDGHQTNLEEMVEEMISVDLEDARKEAFLKQKGFQIVEPRE